MKINKSIFVILLAITTLPAIAMQRREMSAEERSEFFTEWNKARHVYMMERIEIAKQLEAQRRADLEAWNKYSHDGLMERMAALRTEEAKAIQAQERPKTASTASSPSPLPSPSPETITAITGASPARLSKASSTEVGIASTIFGKKL